ncbi:MAG: TIM barrel protein [Oscillospiraceae bacterium]|nr:TIM barrel protein [Oscillospiraceae bacterium]
MKYGIYYAYWEKEWGADYTVYVKKAAELGFDILEISCAGLCDMTAQQIEQLWLCSREYNIQLTAGYGPTAQENLASQDADIVQNAFRFWQKTFAVLKALHITQVGGGLYTYWPANYAAPIDKQGDLQRSIQNMKKLAKMAKQYNITLCMEVLNRHEGYLINTCKECVEYVKAVDEPNVKVMLDTYHMNMEEDDLYDAIIMAKGHLGHVHVGENNRRLPGQGKLIDWQSIAAALHKIGYDGTVVMEPFVLSGGQVGTDIRVWRNLIDSPSQARLDADAAKSVQFLRSVFEDFTCAEQQLPMKNLAHVGLFITDMQQTVAFYTSLLQFNVIWQNTNPSPQGDIQVTFVQNGNLILELVQFPVPQQRGDGWFDHVAIKVKNLDTVIQKLQQKGITFEEGTREDAPQVFENGSRWVLFRGPDNEHIELNEVL